MSDKNTYGEIGRRDFIKTGAVAGAGGVLAGCGTLRNIGKGKQAERPNILLIMTDQLRFDALSANGCKDANTPNMDKLVANGVSFERAYTTNPVCSPARSSFLTGKMPCETGVVTNGRGIVSSVPNVGEWLRPRGYETVYCGKWHLPEPRAIDMPGFTVLPTPMPKTWGVFSDTVNARSCEAYLRHRDKRKPFLLVSCLVEPHDICPRTRFVPTDQLLYSNMTDFLPELPANHEAQPQAPSTLTGRQQPLDEWQWRYQRYFYYRQVEIVDAEIGRIMDALEASGEKNNTLVILTSDHGEMASAHQLIGKAVPYEEAAHIPMVISYPDNMSPGYKDDKNLVSLIDVMKTVCECADVLTPDGIHGTSLLPLLKEESVPLDRDYLVAEVQTIGRMVRSHDFKYYKFGDDPVEMLFDMNKDPGETMNLYKDPKYAAVLDQHRAYLNEWGSIVSPVEPSTTMREGKRRQKNRQN